MKTFTEWLKRRERIDEIGAIGAIGATGAVGANGAVGALSPATTQANQQATIPPTSNQQPITPAIIAQLQKLGWPQLGHIMNKTSALLPQYRALDKAMSAAISAQATTPTTPTGTV